MSRYEFALRIADEHKLDRRLIFPIDFNSLKFKEKIALNTSLNVDKIAKAIDLPL
jgi:dTDP-4-dehydrorhamnose reductase